MIWPRGLGDALGSHECTPEATEVGSPGGLSFGSMGDRFDQLASARDLVLAEAESFRLELEPILAEALRAGLERVTSAQAGQLASLDESTRGAVEEGAAGADGGGAAGGGVRGRAPGDGGGAFGGTPATPAPPGPERGPPTTVEALP